MATKDVMGSSSKKRQTFAKMTRERAVKERRALKQERKEARKAARTAEAAGTAFPADEGDGESTQRPSAVEEGREES